MTVRTREREREKRRRRKNGERAAPQTARRAPKGERCVASPRAYLSKVRAHVRLRYYGDFGALEARRIASLIPIPRANTPWERGRRAEGRCVDRRWFAVCELDAIKRKITRANIATIYQSQTPAINCSA